MSIHKILFVVLTLVSLSVGCSKNDREEAAKKEDGVSTFTYQPGDRTKYRKKDDQDLSQTTSASPKKPADSKKSASAPSAPKR